MARHPPHFARRIPPIPRGDSAPGEFPGGSSAASRQRNSRDPDTGRLSGLGRHLRWPVRRSSCLTPPAPARHPAPSEVPRWRPRSPPDRLVDIPHQVPDPPDVIGTSGLPLGETGTGNARSPRIVRFGTHCPVRLSSREMQMINNRGRAELKKRVLFRRRYPEKPFAGNGDEGGGAVDSPARFGGYGGSP